MQHFKSKIYLHTNASVFEIPLTVYNAQLKVSICHGYMGDIVRKPDFVGYMQTTKVQICLHICTVWSVPVLFALWNIW